MTQAQRNLLLSLESQRRIEKARFEEQNSYSMNSDMIVAKRVTKAVIEQIEAEIKLIRPNYEFED